MKSFGRVLKGFLLAATLFSIQSSSVLAQAPVETGKELFLHRGCFGCHSVEGQRQMLDTPNLAGQSKTYLENQIRTIADATRRGMQRYSIETTSGMIAAAHNTTPAELQTILNYLTSLPLPPALPLAKPLTEEQMKNAEQLYLQKGCAACHGLHGQTPAKPEYPIIAGQTNTYLRRQIRYIRDETRHAGASKEMQEKIHELTDSEADLLADYVSQFETRAVESPRRQ